MTLTLDIIGDCNLRCRFCYQILDQQIMSKENVFSLVDSHPSIGVVNIGGGEPFLHPDILQIIDGIAKRNRRVHVSTNATVIPEGLFDLSEGVRGRVCVQASINAATKGTYERVTGHDLFDGALANVDSLKRSYLTVLSAALYQENLGDLEGLLALGRERELPVRIDLVKPAGDGRGVALLSPVQANLVAGRVLLENISRPGAVYGPLARAVVCPLLVETYLLGDAKERACPDANSHVVYTPSRERRSCEFRENSSIENVIWGGTA